MKTGIYMIKNMINGKFYIGSSVNTNKRLTGHRYELSKNQHSNKLLQRSYNKYGEENFEYIIIQYCEEKDLIKNEQWWFDTLKPELNIAKVAGRTTGYKHTKETKKHLSKVRKGHSWNKGILKSEEHKRKLAKPKSEKHKQSLSKAAVNPVVVNGLNYPNIKQAARELGLDYSRLRKEILTSTH